MALGDAHILDYTLSPAERRVLRAFSDTLKSRLGEKLERIVVFGSRARGDSHAASDIDVLVLLRVPIAEETGFDTTVRRVLDDAWRLEAREYVPISVLVFALERFQKLLGRERRFALDVQREGIRL